MLFERHHVFFQKHVRTNKMMPTEMLLLGPTSTLYMDGKCPAINISVVLHHSLQLVFLTWLRDRG